MTDAVAWTSAIQRCVTSRSYGLVDESIILVYVDAPRVFHPVQSLVAVDDDPLPLVVVFRLHPTIASLVQTLHSAKTPSASIDTVVATLVFRDQSVAIANANESDVMMAPFLAPQMVNLTGGALCLYGESQQSASEAMAAMTLAITSNTDRLATGMEHIVVVVEHSDGYMARDFVISGPSLQADALPARPRLMMIQKREWNSGSMAQLSLDDALEAYEAGYIEEQEINGTTEDATNPQALRIHVSAAFEVREHAKSVRGSTFLLDVDEVGRTSPTPAAGGLPPVALLSQWDGLENVRSLLCKPPPHSASTLCFSSHGHTSSGISRSGPRETLPLLQHLDQAIQNDARQTWKSLGTDVTAPDVLQHFKKFLKTIDQDDFLDVNQGEDDTINNTIESTVSMTLDGERERANDGVSRTDMDPVEKVWDFLAKNADGTDLTQQLLQELMLYLSTTRIFPAPNPDNDTELAKFIRLRHDEIQGVASANTFATAAQASIRQPADAFSFLIEAGEWKMKRDVVHTLAQAGFSSQECSEFVLAMPRFDVNTRVASHAHWRAMDHVLQLCTLGQSVQLPVSFMRKAVHDCVAYHARSGNGGAMMTDPLILVDLQSFLPDRLRSSIADSLYWGMSIAFNADYEHRLHICQDIFHPTVQSPCRHLRSPDELVLDDTTLRALHRSTPEELLLQNDMVQFMTKLEDACEKRLYEELHDINMPSGTTRYDCTIRRLQVFP